MVHVSLTMLILLYLFLVLGAISVMWISGEFQRAREARRLRRFQLVCGVCGYHYEDRSDDPLPNCPECGRPNERETVHEI